MNLKKIVDKLTAGDSRSTHARLSNKKSNKHEKPHSESINPLIAAYNGRLSDVKWHHLHGSDMEIRNNDGFTALHMAACFGFNEIVKYLIEETNADVNVKNHSGLTPLHLAAANRQAETVRSLTKHYNANVNATNDNGSTPLHLAVAEGFTAIVNFLKYKGKANLYVTDREGLTILHTAALNGRIDILTNLIEDDNFPVELQTDNGFTPLHIAAAHRQVDTVSALTEKFNASVDAETKNGITALHFSAKAGYADVVDCLIQNNATVNKQAHNNWTPSLVALKYEHLQVAKLLIQSESWSIPREKQELIWKICADDQKAINLYKDFCSQFTKIFRSKERVLLTEIINHSGSAAKVLHVLTFQFLLALKAKKPLANELMSSYLIDNRDNMLLLIKELSPSVRADIISTIKELGIYPMYLDFSDELILEKISIDETVERNLTIFKQVICHSNLRKITIRNLKLSNEYIDALNEALVYHAKNRTQLTNFQLESCGLQGSILTKFAKRLRELPHLKSLSFSDNYLNDDDLRVLIKLFKAENHHDIPFRQLKLFDLSNNCIKINSCDSFRDDFTSLLPHDNQIKINLAGNYIYDLLKSQRDRHKLRQTLLNITQCDVLTLSHSSELVLKEKNGTTYLSYKYNNQEFLAQMSPIQLGIFLEYKHKRFGTDNAVLMNLVEGLQDSLRLVPKLKARNFKIKSEELKQLDYCHPDAPLKYLLARHGHFQSKINPNQKLVSLLRSFVTVTRDTWQVHLLVYKKTEHTMIAVEGILGSGQRFFEMSDLLAPPSSGSEPRKPKINHISTSPEKIASDYPDKNWIATFDVTRAEAKTILNAIKNDKPPEHYSSTPPQINTEFLNKQPDKTPESCFTWAVKLINKHSPHNIIVQTGPPSWTIKPLAEAQETLIINHTKTH